ncbi:MAG: 30S ribosomal protein S20 [Dehalococcoidia bacterium]|nr:30S ribosomal protein S20 [Dehalococcoidia bacterium]
MGTKSAIRAARKAQRRRGLTRSMQSQVKNSVAQAHQLLDTDNAGSAAAVQEALRVLDRASGKGIIHPNTAGRHKSSLVRGLNLKAAAK